MSAPKTPGSEPVREEQLVQLAEDLAEAIADGDVQSAREAHSAIGRELETASSRPSAVIDLARERARRATSKGGAR